MYVSSDRSVSFLRRVLRKERPACREHAWLALDGSRPLTPETVFRYVAVVEYALSTGDQRDAPRIQCEGGTFEWRTKGGRASLLALLGGLGPLLLRLRPLGVLPLDHLAPSVLCVRSLHARGGGLRLLGVLLRVLRRVVLRGGRDGRGRVALAGAVAVLLGGGGLAWLGRGGRTGRRESESGRRVVRPPSAQSGGRRGYSRRVRNGNAASGGPAQPEAR